MPAARTQRDRRACDNCRRKKSKCSGDRPTCLKCTRLGQVCSYASSDASVPHDPNTTVANPVAAIDDPAAVDHPAANTSVADAMVAKPLTENTSGMDSLEANPVSVNVASSNTVASNPADSLPATHAALPDHLNTQHAKNQMDAYFDEIAEILHKLKHEQSKVISQAEGQQPLILPRSGATDGSLDSVLNIKLPAWEWVETVATLYFVYCDCQPLPLFDRSTFMETLNTRDPEVLFAMIALSSRFLNNPHARKEFKTLEADFTEAARIRVMDKITNGRVELSTLQTLCLLSLVDFTNGRNHRASTHSTLAIQLAHCASLESEDNTIQNDSIREERRRCFWSAFILTHLHGAAATILDFTAEENVPGYPSSSGRKFIGASTNDAPSLQGDEKDEGIIAYAIQLIEIWSKTTRYARRRGKQIKVAPWAPSSEYASIMAEHINFDTGTPDFHRFKHSNFEEISAEEFDENRGYWGPWLFIQFLYHTNLCLLNHPLLLALRSRNFVGHIPEIFLQHTSDLVSAHARWIIGFIDMVETKSIMVSDPVLGHCVAIVATIYLLESVQSRNLREEEQDAFAKCLRFIHAVGKQWPHIEQIANKLERLENSVSIILEAEMNVSTPSRDFLMELGRIWEILDYSSSCDSTANQIFGTSLSRTSNQPYESSATSMLSKSTGRPDSSAYYLDGYGQDPSGGDNYAISSNALNGLADAAVASTMPLAATSIPHTYLDDELTVLAESFFTTPGGQTNNRPFFGRPVEHGNF